MERPLVSQLLESPNWGLVAVLVMAWAFVLYGFHPLARWKYRHIPGPRYRFLVGGLPEIASMGMETACSQWAKQYGGTQGVYKVFHGALPHVVFCSPEACKKVLRLQQKYEYPILSNPEVPQEDQEGGSPSLTSADREMNNNMVYTSGHEWAKMRSVWNPEFKTEKLRAHFGIIESGVEKLVDGMEVYPDGSVIDMWPIAGKLTMDVIATASFGITCDTQGKVKNEEKSMADKLAWAFATDMESADVMDVGMAMLYLFPGLTPLIDRVARKFPSKAQRRGMQARTMVKDVFSTLIRGIRSDKPEENVVDPTSFLAAMAHVRDEQGNLKDETWTLMQSALFVSTGFDTTSSALSYTTYLLAANPDKEAKLLAEIDALGPDFVPTFDNMQTGTALPYLHAVLQEALRMYPPAPFTIRQAKEDMTVGGYFIPKGTFLKVALYCMHRSAHYWKDPVQFLPERFMENEPEFVGASPDAFAPFGGGARRCPGYNLAQIEAKMALLRLYQRYTFRTLPGDKGLKTKTLVTLTPVGGVRMTVHKRQD